MKRLFLFAGYAADGNLTQAHYHLLDELKANGDVVEVFDNGLADEHLSKLTALTLHCQAKRHGEYDFGSFKRAFAWAGQNLQLDSYDYLYMVNDSVVGPLKPLRPYLERMEGDGHDFVGFVYNPHRTTPHLQTWFVGMSRMIFLEGWFSDFLGSVSGGLTKGELCVKYEAGLTALVAGHGFKPYALFTLKGKDIYNKPLRLVRRGLPFVKQDAFRRHNGSLGRQLHVIARRHNGRLIETFARNKGLETVLTPSRLTAAGRYLRYLFDKIAGRR